MRKGVLTMILTGWCFFSAAMPPAVVGASDFHCVQLPDSRNSLLCAPPRGSLLKNEKDRYVCGPGQCLRQASGRTICSAVPGGAAALDSRDRGLCDGGCVEATEDQCVTPIPDPS